MSVKGKIKEAAGTGTMQALDKLRKELPPGITGLLQIPGLGPKRPALDAARTRMERQMAQAGPALAREVGGLFGPLLRELRTEIARDLAEDRLAEQGASPWPLD